MFNSKYNKKNFSLDFSVGKIPKTYNYYENFAGKQRLMNLITFNKEYENNKLEDQLQIFIKKKIKNKKNSFSLCKKELKNEISLINSSYFSLEGKIENLQKLVESFFFIFSETILKIEKSLSAKLLC